MIYQEDQLIRLGGVTLPGLVKKLEIKCAAAIDEVEVEGSAVKPKQAVGYEDAKVTIELIIDATANETALQKLTRINNLFKASGQLASRNLDGSEQIYLGGANAVRAYPQGEGSGDAGILGTAEVRWYTDLPGLVLSTYLDAGHVKRARDGSEGSETLKGWGIAASYTRPGDWFARLDYARRIGDSPYLSEDAKSKGRVWFLLGKVW